MNLLMSLFLAPFASALALCFFPRGAKRAAFLLSLLPLAILAWGFPDWIGARIDHNWIPVLSVKFLLSIDALSLIFIALTVLIIPVSILAVNGKKFDFPNPFYALILLLEGLLIGFFTSGDLVLFTLFWESMLLPIYFIISYWGGEQREAAAMKFLLYTLAGSALMVIAVLVLYFLTGTFTIDQLTQMASKMPYAPYLCIIFLLAFAVKTPLFPFHGWLPDAYFQAPVTGSILLSALLSKAGIYGLLRIGIPLFSEQIELWSPLLLGAAITGVLYGGLSAWMQTDFKRLIAYSSLSHVNFILAGIFINTEIAASGALLQSFNHGITIAALFLAAGWLEERINTTQINKFSGLSLYMPILCWTTLFFVLSSVAIPGLNNFVGEIMIMFGFFGKLPWLVPALALTTVISVIYMLRWMQKTYFGTPSPLDHSWVDINQRELFKALPLIVLILLAGIYPSPFLILTDSAVQNIKSTMEPNELKDK